MIIYLYTPSPLVHDSNLCVAHRVTGGGSRVELYNIIVGLSALLVSTNRAMREPFYRGTSIRLAPRFLCIRGIGIILGKMDKKYDEYLCIELIYISLFIIIIDMVKKMLFLYFF